MNEDRVLAGVGKNVLKTHARLKQELEEATQAVKEIQSKIDAVEPVKQKAQLLLDHPELHEVEDLNDAAMLLDTCNNKIQAHQLNLNRAKEIQAMYQNRFASFIASYDQIISFKQDVEQEIHANNLLLEWVNKRLNAENKDVANRPKYGPLTLKLLQSIDHLSRERATSE